MSGCGESLRWSGALPARAAEPAGGWAPKVFLGGLPWDITEHALMQALRTFAPIRSVRADQPSSLASCELDGSGGKPALQASLARRLSTQVDNQITMQFIPVRFCLKTVF